MDVYIYNAALYCADCGEHLSAELTKLGKKPADPEDEYSYDSGDFPKGPFADGGGEADCPQHCDACNVFLENELTEEGSPTCARRSRVTTLRNEATARSWRSGRRSTRFVGLKKRSR